MLFVLVICNKVYSICIFIHSSSKLLMISVWQMKLEAFRFNSKSQKSKCISNIFDDRPSAESYTFAVLCCPTGVKLCSKNVNLKVMSTQSCLIQYYTNQTQGLT